MTEKRRCGKKAVEIIAWANKQVPCCKEHAAVLRRIGECMGAPCEGLPTDDPDVICTQQLSEAPHD